MDNNINSLLQKVSVNLATYLENVLPSLFENWWESAVINKLTFQQQRQVEQRQIETLGALDIAALLKVLDQNWYQISTRMNLTSEARHFVKEMQTIRNRLAHPPAEGLSIDDTYRDLDTLQRFATVIKSDQLLLNEIRDAKLAIVAKNIPEHTKNTDKVILTTPSPNINKADSDKQSAKFAIGQIVYPKSNPDTKGAVIDILPGQPENRLKVFISGETIIYYESQLEIANRDDNHAQSLSCDQFHSHLTALQLRYPGLSTLYSLNAARIDFIPYQFRPVLRFIRSDRPRLLIADGVGVGKTIEAGLILRELQARRDIRSILVICPRPLVTERKWQNEMKRFEENFTHLDGPTLRYCINEMDMDGVWPSQHQKVILPYSLFDEALLYGSDKNKKRKRTKGLLELDPPPRFDIVIVDEAHHIRNQDTFRHKAVKFFCDHAEAVVFLTATPIQLGSKDLFVLLNTLRPDIIIDPQSFEHMAEPNQFINKAVSIARAKEDEWQLRTLDILNQAATTSWGQSIMRHNPNFIRISSMLAETIITSEERVQVITDIESMHTFSGIINRTRRRDIGDFTIRKPETVEVEFTSSQKELHDRLLIVQSEIFRRIHGNKNIKFMMTTIRRQAASCIYGLAPFLEDILNRHIDELSWEEADDTESISQDHDDINQIQPQIKAILDSLINLDPYDPKLEALCNIIKDKQKLPNKKIMLFSSFRHTLSYLYKKLKEREFRIGMVHGGTPDEERVQLRIRFEKLPNDKDSLDLLLFSEIGCEGLDYQFCDCIVNYDLPWNPMRVEQRIGRIDRNGQKSESVAIINLITPDTVDADIYERCLVRIGVFNNAIGSCEEILGEITREIRNIAENYSLNKDELKLKLQQLADNKIRLIQEEEILEQRQVELFGIRLSEDQMKKEIEDASSFWLSPESIRKIITLYLKEKFEKEQDVILGDKPLKTLRLSQDARSSLLLDFQQLSRQNTNVYRDWENWLKGGNPHLFITFESSCAMKHPEAAFIMPLHPLVKQAAISIDTSKRVITSLKVKTNKVAAGRYEFAIYQWCFQGIKEDLILQPITLYDALTVNLYHLLEKAVDAKIEITGIWDSPVWEQLDTQHYRLWSQAREKHQQKTKELAEYRRESLSTSHRARIALLHEQLNQTNNDKIQRMRQSQIYTAEADYARRIQELDIAMERADITSGPVGYGIIEIY